MFEVYLVYQVELPDMRGDTTIRGVSDDGKRGVITLNDEQLKRTMENLGVSEKIQMFGCKLVMKQERMHREYAILPPNVKEINFGDTIVYYKTSDGNLESAKFAVV